MGICCILCKTEFDSKSNVTFHRLPSNPNDRELWLNNLNLTSGSVSKNARICSNHFNKRDFYKHPGRTRTLLKKHAVPIILNEPTDDQLSSSGLTEIMTTKSPGIDLESSDTEIRDYNIQVLIPNYEESSRSTMSVQFVNESDQIPFTDPAEANSVNREQGQKRKNIGEIPHCLKRLQMDKNFVNSNLVRYIGDIDISDWQSPAKAMRNWGMAMQEIETLKSKLKVSEQKNKRFEKRINTLKSLLTDLKRKNMLSEEAADVISTSLPRNSKVILQQLMKSKGKGKYPKELQTFAATLQFYSTKAYEYVRKTFIGNLPHSQTIRRWYKNVNGKPGISSESLATIQREIQEAEKQQKTLYFSLMVDEIAIREQIELDGEEVCGYIDYGTGSQDNDSLPNARYALTFLVVNVNGSWKLPVAYYLIHSLTGTERANLLSSILTALHEIRANVLSVTMDGAASNLSMINNLGGNISPYNTKNYFLHPVTNEKIWAFLDACHMLTLIRNTFAFAKCFKDGNGNEIEWRYITNLVALQEREGLHAATKVRRRHIHFENEKMKVKLAAEIFSNSVADAINFCENDLKLPEFHKSKATTEFIRNINDIFDILNSTNLLCKKDSKACISERNIIEKKIKIEQLISYIRSMMYNDEPIIVSSKKMGFLGMVISLQSVTDIAVTLIIAKKMSFLLTYKFSQDHLELFFSAIRTRGGHNNNPSAKQFRYAYKRLLVHAQIYITGNTNSLTQDNTDVLPVSARNCIVEKRTPGEAIDCDIDVDTLLNSDMSEYKMHVIAYIAGFIVRRITKNMTRQICQALLTMTDFTFSKLQRRKAWGHLIQASPDVISLCVLTEKIFRTFQKSYSQKQIIPKIIIAVLSNVSSTTFDNVEHMLEQTPLEDHRTQLIRLISHTYIKLRLHYENTKKMNNKRIRSLYNKLILFKNQ